MPGELNGKKLLVLGGMRISCEIVRKAQEMGVYVAVTDYNLPEKSPAKQIADETFMVSTTDVDAVVELIREENMDGVITGFVDLLLPYYADICERATLPSLATKDQYKIFINKKKYKVLLQEYGIPVPEEYEVSEIASEQLLHINYPVIVKPADSSGARGVTLCGKEDELELACLNAMRFSASIIVEEYLEGEEVTAFWMMQDEEPYFIGLANRHVEKNQGENIVPLPVGYSFPSIHTQKYIDKIVPQMSKMLKDTGVSNGLLFLQCRIVDGLPYVYDLGLRLTGSLEYYIFSELCNFSPLEMIIEFALTGSQGKKITDKVDPYFNGKYGWNISFLMKPGKISKIVGFEEIKNIPGVINVVSAHEIGDEIKDADKGLLKQICCRVLGYSETVNEMRDTINKVTSEYQVLDSNGKSLLLPVFDFDNYRETVV